jgi:acyl-CoA thioesterase-1
MMKKQCPGGRSERRSRKGFSGILCCGLLIGMAASVVPDFMFAAQAEEKSKPGIPEGTESKATKILFLGDSLTEGYGVARPKTFPSLVTDQLNKRFVVRRMGKRVEPIYGGISGSTSASAPSRLKWFLKAKPHLLFLAMGANDGLRGLPVSELEKNLSATIELAQQEGIDVILAGMKLPPNYGLKNVKEFEAVYPRLAKKYSIPLVPFLLEGVGGETKLNQADGIHPNEAGHSRMADLIFPHLEKALTK